MIISIHLHFYLYFPFCYKSICIYILMKHLVLYQLKFVKIKADVTLRCDTTKVKVVYSIATINKSG
jgi:hypothetical protein